MPGSSEHRLPDDLERVATRLRADRAQADSLELDRIKRTVMTRAATPRQGKGGFASSRLATVFTLVALIGGAGGAIAIGATGSSNGPQGSAANAQYCNAKKGCPPPKHNCGRHHHQACPTKPKHCYYWTSKHGRYHRHMYECSAGEKAGTGKKRPHSKSSHGKSQKGKSNNGKSNKGKSNNGKSNKGSKSKNPPAPVNCTTTTKNGQTILTCP